ncbi:response regulator transcription factor [bacterium]|nr:response regulator transcription factor [bacterium]
MSHETILLVDDEADILELLRYNLDREGYKTISAMTGEEALQKIESHKPDLVILDLMLPGIDGLEITRRIKNNPARAGIPIIMLTAKGEEADIVTGLELGADDYVTKPFSPRILLARIKAMIRRKHLKTVEPETVIHIHEMVIHPGRREVIVDGNPIQLTYTEFQVLYYLAKRPGWVSTRSQIVDAVKGEDYYVTDRSVDVQIVGLRKKLGSSGKYIQTVRGVGYRLSENSDENE